MSIRRRPSGWACLAALCCAAAVAPPPSSGKPAKPSSAPIQVIRLHGNVGTVPGQPSGDRSCDADGLRRDLERARRAGAVATVLDIQGPGGLVSEMQAMVKVLVDAQTAGQRVVALPRDAFSAWSIVALACKEIVVTPTTRMGAAVSIRREGDTWVEATDGKDAVSQKFAAPWNALCRQVSELTGRPQAVMDAMRIQTAELWWSPTAGFAARRGEGEPWEQFDDGVKVCCLTGVEMLRTGLARASVTSLQELPKALGLPEGTPLKGDVRSATPSVGSTGKGAAATADRLRKACSRLRETASRLKDVNFGTETVQREIWLGGTNTERRTEPESAGMRSQRLQDALRAAMRQLPPDDLTKDEERLAERVAEIRTLLQEAVTHARNAAFDASKDRAQAAFNLIRGCPDCD